MGIDGQGSQLDTNLIINNENEVEEAVLADLSILENDVVSGTENDVVSETHEQLSHTQAEQYYALGKTQVEYGDLENVTNAINNHTDIKDARISILGGADELFMSEQKWQQILDEEVAKLRLLQGGFSGPNLTMLDQLILDLTNELNHTELASRYLRSDGKSNVGNAKLIAARIASGYVEVFTTIQQKIQDTDTAVSIAYTIDRDQCVIWNNGNNLSDRKIQVDISLDIHDTIQLSSGSQDEKQTWWLKDILTIEQTSPQVVDEYEIAQSTTDHIQYTGEYLSDTVRIQIGTAFLLLRQNHLTWIPPSSYRYGPGTSNPSSLWSAYDNAGSESVAIYDDWGSKVLEIVLHKNTPPSIGLWSNMLPVADVNQLMSVLDDIAHMDKMTFDAFLLDLRPPVTTLQDPVNPISPSIPNANEANNTIVEENKQQLEESEDAIVDIILPTEEIKKLEEQREKIPKDIATAQVIVWEGNTIDFAKHNALLQIVSAVSGSLDKKDVVGWKDYVILDQTAIPQSDGSYRYSISYKILPPEYITDEVVDSWSAQVVETRENIDIPFAYGSREWLASKLTGKLEGISLEQFYTCLEWKSISINYNNPYNKAPLTIQTTLSWIDNPVLRDKILSYIDRGDIRGMYEDLYGMHDNIAINPYLHYRPSDVINPLMLHAMSLRLWHSYDMVENKEQLDRMKMPDDVRKAWKDYKKLKLHLLSANNWPNNFAIVSKTDFNIYLFLPDGTLVGKQNVVLGKNPSDTERLVSNTPAGTYKTNGFFNKPGFNAKYYDKWLGNYIKLWSLEDRFKNVQSHDAGIGVHELYDPAKRAAALLDDVTRNPLVRDRKRMSDGCINASNSPLAFGALFTHLVPKSDIATCVYVTPSPDETAISRYYSMLQSQAPIAMK